MTDPFDPAPAVNAGSIKRDGNDSPYVFAIDYEGEPNYERKTVRGRKGYTRVTTFIDVLDDKTNLDVYHQRNVVAGMVAEPYLLVAAKASIDAGQGNLDDRQVKDGLNHVAAEARRAMYEDRKADTGTALHYWCEQCDLLIAQGASPADALAQQEDCTVNGHVFSIDAHRADVQAYLQLTVPLMRPLAIEKLIINDTLKVAGTPDRRVEWIGPSIKPPHGPNIEPGDQLIDDTKSGNVEYGQGKFAMQMGIYANSVEYDQDSNTRTEMPESLRRDWALVVHVPAGQGQARLVWLDIGEGWLAVINLATKVRAWRSQSKKLATALPWPTLTERISTAFTAEQVRELWATNRTAWTDENTEEAAQRVAFLNERIAA